MALVLIGNALPGSLLEVGVQPVGGDPAPGVAVGIGEMDLGPVQGQGRGLPGGSGPSPHRPRTLALRRSLAQLVLLLLVACSGGDSVHLTGSVTFFGTSYGGVKCAAGTGVGVTVRNGEGSVIGTTQTGTLASPSIGPMIGGGVFASGPCEQTAPFTLDLPHEDFYVVQLGKTEPLEPMSYDDLKAQDFHLDLSLTS